MRTEVQGDAHLGVPKAFRDDLGVYALFKRERRIGVAEVVESDHQEFRQPNLAGKLAAESIRV